MRLRFLATLFNRLGEVDGETVYSPTTLRGVYIRRMSGDGRTVVYIPERELDCRKTAVGREVWRELTDEAAEDGVTASPADPRRLIFTLRGGGLDRIRIWGECGCATAEEAAAAFAALPDDPHRQPAFAAVVAASLAVETVESLEGSGAPLRHFILRCK